VFCRSTGELTCARRWYPGASGIIHLRSFFASAFSCKNELL
jgi:hypothetical protein